MSAGVSVCGSSRTNWYKYGRNCHSCHGDAFYQQIQNIVLYNYYLHQHWLQFTLCISCYCQTSGCFATVAAMRHVRMFPLGGYRGAQFSEVRLVEGRSAARWERGGVVSKCIRLKVCRKKKRGGGREYVHQTFGCSLHTPQVNTGSHRYPQSLQEMCPWLDFTLVNAKQA